MSDEGEGAPFGRLPALGSMWKPTWHPLSFRSPKVGVELSLLKLLLMFLILFVVVIVAWLLFFSSVERNGTSA